MTRALPIGSSVRPGQLHVGDIQAALDKLGALA